MKPLDPTVTGVMVALYSILLLMSFCRPEYFSNLISWETLIRVSNGTVSSKLDISFFSFVTNTMSGFCAVMMMSGGMEPPAEVVYPGRSEKTLYLLVLVDLTI